MAKASPFNFPFFSLSFSILLITSSCCFRISTAASKTSFSIPEATVEELQLALRQNQLTSRRLVEFYLERIKKLNPLLRGVIEVNPDALYLADEADKKRKAKGHASIGLLHGIPVLLKDNIATKDKMNTTAGSYALLRSVVPRDAGVVAKLRKAGAIILGKASLSEWAHFRSSGLQSGWCARSGQGKNPYVLSEDPCGSSSGSGISVAANLAAVSLGTETDGSILCPSGANSVVGIKPTIGLTSRAGVVPISPRQDTVGPMCRTVSDAVHVLDAIAGVDHRDKATLRMSRYIPKGGYKQFLKPNGLKGKRLGIVRDPFFNVINGRPEAKVFEKHLDAIRRQGATIVDYLNMGNIDVLSSDDETTALVAEFKLSLNEYLKDLVASPVRYLSDVIAFNNKCSKERTKEFGQDLFLRAEATKGIGNVEKAAKRNLTRFSQGNFEKMMREHKLDALVSATPDVCVVLATGGHPGISVPAGYGSKGVPFGIFFGGVRGSETKLIEIAYGFEQATKIRKPPSFKP